MNDETERIEAARPRRFRPYPEYKDSGIEWLPEIPCNWASSRLRYCMRMNVSKTEVKVLDRTTEVSFVPMESVDEYGGLRLDQTRALSEVLDGYTYFRNGDTVVAKITPCFENGKGALADGLCNGIAFGTTEFHALRPLGDLDERFLFYLTVGAHFRRMGAAAMYGAGGQKRVPDDFIRELRHPIPTTAEQRGIAAFLDRETAKIDRLVAKKERLIELLQEKRAALITRAVTRGLDPNVPMKNSGMEWLGRIPAHWEVKRVKWLARVESGHTPDKKVEQYWRGGDIRWVSLNDSGYLRCHDYIGETAYLTNQLGLRHSSARLLPPRTVVFSRDATVGLCAITLRPMAVSQHFIAWVCSDQIIPEYLLRVFDVMHDELERLTMGATIRTIGMPDVKALATAVPPVEEQQLIVMFLENEHRVLSRLSGRVREAIARLKEFRAALISAAVTGRIDVRDEVAS